MNELIAKLSDEQWNKKFGGYFSSILSLCNHLYICDFNWLKRFALLRDFEYIKDEFFKKGLKFGSHAFEDKNEYIQKRKELDEYMKRFTGEVKEEDLNKSLTYKDSHGDEHNQEYGLVILHVFNHQTHHRGMISIYLEEMNVENDYSNIMDII
jgi:uncharacterized damage-inducible protein DinB